ncbi:MAG: helix-turn-helix transcriptional regulator [Phycisphaerales bacterium]|nr:helix-turn-helix transcriptional regulator [Phycisphaerales bacterium]
MTAKARLQRAANQLAAASVIAAGLGEMLRAARREAGLSQAELAARLGCPQPTIARWERGGSGLDPQRLPAILAALDATSHRQE